MQLIYLAIIGACIGSFINVVALRLPRKESLIWPGSHCRSCGSDVRWYDNVPVVAWLQLGGRCRDCKASIPLRYPAVEVLSAGLWVSAAMAAPTSLGLVPSLFKLWAGVVLVSLLLPLVLIDLDHMWLPEPLCRLGLLLGITATVAAAVLNGWEEGSNLLLNHLIAAAAALLALEMFATFWGIFIRAINFICSRQIKPLKAIGSGDAKLAAMAGAWLGLKGVGMALAIANVSGALFGLIAFASFRLKWRQPFPFGPFIAIGIWGVWLCGPDWWWYQWQNLIQIQMGL
ncbi:MAG: A24 family peptidase [Prochlorococcus sp.]|jgi:leader peptidase (prepilin peptidase)/N-methyltransferase